MFPFSQLEYTRNESFSFTLDCDAFGMPLPTLYWLPGPIDATINITDGRYNLSNSQLGTFLASVATFDGSRFPGLSNQCLSGGGNADAGGCAAPDVASCAGLVDGSLCSVPCALSIVASQTTDANGRQVSRSQITICNLMKVDELSYTCVAVNNITNAIGTSEGSSANLIVQG